MQHERAVNLISTQVPEGSGWRGALAAFLGDATTADFYAQVEATIVSDGVVATTDELMAAISGTLSDAAVAAAAQTQTDFTTCEWSTAARTACNEGLGCGVAATAPPTPTPAASDATTAPALAPASDAATAPALALGAAAAAAGALLL